MDRVVRAEQSGQAGVSAHAVVMTVRADQGAVETHVAGLACGNGREVSREEVLLGDTVLFVEQGENIESDGITLTIGVGTSTQQDVQILGRDGLSERLGGLLLREMREQIVDVEHGIGLVLTDDYVDDGAVLLDYHAVDGEGNGHPLVLADTAEVAGLEEGKAAILVQGGLLDVNAGIVHVGRHDADAVLNGLAAHAEQVEIAATVVVVVLAAHLERHAEGVGDVALALGHLNGDGDRLALGLSGVQIRHVAGGVVVGGLDGCLVSLLVEVGLLVAQTGFEFFLYVFHNYFLTVFYFV